VEASEIIGDLRRTGKRSQPNDTKSAWHSTRTRTEESSRVEGTASLHDS